MDSQAVLVLGNHANRELAQMLSGIGFVPRVWGSMRHSLDKLRHEKFTAVIVDRKFTHADVLEFVLNVRDIDQDIPLIVIGPGKDEKMDVRIKRQNRTIILAGSEGDDSLAEKLARVLKGSEHIDV
jgi:FixJ family two-component response regulator